jgi:hypothetical protein
MVSSTYVQITSTDDEELWRTTAHMLAYYRAEPLARAPRDFVTLHVEGGRLRVTAPHRVSALTVNACLDTSRQAEMDAAGNLPVVTQGSPYQWLWTEALPLLLPAYLVDRLNAEYKLRDRTRQKATRLVARGMNQERLF